MLEQIWLDLYTAWGESQNNNGSLKCRSTHSNTHKHGGEASTPDRAKTNHSARTDTNKTANCKATAGRSDTARCPDNRSHGDSHGEVQSGRSDGRLPPPVFAAVESPASRHSLDISIRLSVHPSASYMDSAPPPCATLNYRLSSVHLTQNKGARDVAHSSCCRDTLLGGTPDFHSDCSTLLEF
ncbi:hypothetical protein ANANG_G00144670 [Anguilla anguilla]|uniref:Uncharacterized protein n=1 Tax=Anguilla anguilla TaxID=7936 RepID=A0A9D3MBH0_ANGAN|nr:hypothetical protein ANANG_G00144670 [Anguilla anguilla]